ncbi:MAG: NAD(P)-binding domain-containing protein [Clostridiales bacterium]|nr:NAD(P)-binding domain-containing protein [Clostridiales bacterium]
MTKVVLLNNISDSGKKLYKNHFETTENYDDAQLAIVRSAKMHDLKTDHLLAIARAGAGVNNVPIARCADEGVIVFNTPGANANAVKELLLLGMLMSARDVLGGTVWAKTLKGNGEDVPSQVEKGKSTFSGTELSGKRVSVIGLGAIGSALANTCDALGMEVAGYSPSFAKGMRPKALHVRIKAKNTVEDAVKNADYVVLSLPLKDDTRKMVNHSILSRMKEGAVLLNFSRAELINENDLEEALKSGKLRKYVTDFTTDRLLHMDDVICLPHMGASTTEATENCALMAVKQIMDYVENGNIKNSVNYPEISLGQKIGPRLSVLFNSDEAYSEEIEQMINDSGVEIITLKSAFKGGYGAMIVDVESTNDQLLDILRQSDAIKLVRNV